MTSRPESEVTSNNSNDSDRSNDQLIVSRPKIIIPFSNMIAIPSQNHTSAISHTQSNAIKINTSYRYSSSTSRLPLVITNPGSTKSENTSQHVFNRAINVADSSPSPHLQLQTMSEISQSDNSKTSSIVSDEKVQSKIPGKGGRGSRLNNNRPPRGAVNFERSYQICQAVIEKSANRHQLKAQIRPQPSLLATAITNSSTKSTNIYKVLILFFVFFRNQNQFNSIFFLCLILKQTNRTKISYSKKNYVQRQVSPVLVQHLVTSNQGIFMFTNNAQNI